MSMKYFVLKYKYLHTTSRTGNLGDNVQSIAAIHTLQEVGVRQDEIGYVNRDDLSLRRSTDEHGIFVTQGWFGCMPGQKSLPLPDGNLTPLYFGFHINEGSWHLLRNNDQFAKSLRKHEPIGCRDIGTRDFLRSLGVRAYFSRCLTLNFRARKTYPRDEKVFVVDPGFDISRHIPEKLWGRVTSYSQVNYAALPRELSGNWPMTDDDVEAVDATARARLEQWEKEATLMITGRIHVAMPCAAMGIPVIFCFEKEHDSRASVIKEILPIFGAKNASSIDWNVSAPPMERMKEEIRLMFGYRLQSIESSLGVCTRRMSEADFRRGEMLVEEACTATDEKNVYTSVPFSKDDILETAFGDKRNDFLENDRSLILFGAGSAGSHLCSVFNHFGIHPICFCDNSVSHDDERNCKGLPIISFETLKRKHKNDWIVITTMAYKNEIHDQLLESGFSKGNIFLGDSIIRRYIDFATCQ